MTLQGKTVVVTGAAGTMGLAVVRAMLEDGAQVALVDIDALRLDGVIRFVRGTTAGVPCDVSDPAAVKSAHQQVEKLLGPVDILVNNAGVLSNDKAEATGDHEWRRVLATNLDGAFYWARAVLPGMKARGWGRIINVVSQQAFRAYGNSGAYGVSKAGLVALTRSQAEAWSARGVCCNAVAPGVVHTPLTEPVFADPEKVAAHARRTMIGRNGVPMDFAGCAVFLASASSAAVTGQTLFVDGGYSST